MPRVTRGTGVLVHRGDGQRVPWGGIGRAGWVYRVGNTGSRYCPATLLGEQRIQRSGPGSPCRGLEWWDPAAGAPGPDHPLRTLQVLRGPLRCQDLPLSSQTAVQTRKSLKTVTFTVKLVKTAKCRRNMSIRPTIVPISKTGPRIHLLKN